MTVSIERINEVFNTHIESKKFVIKSIKNPNDILWKDVNDNDKQRVIKTIETEIKSFEDLRNELLS